ncbi:uncharacterized protein [Clytia hemisphaerica]|uniref:uncharacterized protein n=1 Tax=Clytia hemisphaerica TaxID=252671 RepID=UPI0034D4FF93
MEQRHVENASQQQEEQDIINPKKELRCSLVKCALKSFVVQHVSRYYQAAAVRVMLPTPSNMEVWQARQLLEEKFSSEQTIAGFFSCGTALYNQTKDDQHQAIAGISFWVMFDWPEIGIEAYESYLTKIARGIGLETVHCKAVKGRGVRSINDSFVASLYIVLKDHNNETLLHHFAKSQIKFVKAEAEREGINLETVVMGEGVRYSSKHLTSLWLTKSMDSNVAKELKNAVQSCRGLLEMKLVDFTSAEEPVVAALRPVSRFMQSIESVKVYMNTFHYGLYDGSVYKKVPQSRFTYVYCSSVHDFIHFILGNDDVANTISQHVQQIISLLSVKTCRIIKPISIDYNFIEVTPHGTCFNIAKKCFELEPRDLKGSPRAFVKYAYDANKRPYPEPFIKGVENSFGNPVVRKRFYKKYYQLLVHKQFPHKETKLCLVGPADSAKTSWFSPFKGIIPARYIAGVMNDGRFSAALIDDQTQIVMMDEWTPDSLSCEDAKRVLQGGMNFLPQKHKEGLRVNYNSGFFITTNVYPDFGNEIDNEAIRKRLDVFQTSSLKRKDPSVEGWLRINCMEVFHYLAEQLKHEPIFDTPTHRWNGAGAAKGMGAVFNDFDFSPMDLMLADENAEFSLSQTPSIPSNNVQTADADVPSSPSNSKDSATVEAIDHAIMEADRVEGVLYEDLSWDTPLFDNASEKCDEEYVQKVVELASNNEGCWDALHISDKAVSMFRRRARVFWDGPDTVYDAWLVRKGYERPWFDTNHGIARSKLRS